MPASKKTTKTKNKTTTKKVATKKLPAKKTVAKKPVSKKSPAKSSVAPHRRLRRPGWQHLYAVGSLAVLFATSLLWSILGARLHQNNSDQLIDPRLFEFRATFHQATFPSTHSFLLKWPLFYLIKVMNFSDASYIATTVILSLVTIGFVALVIYRIERRPVVFGTLMLALASVLLLVPTVPAAGVLLPVNMAMLATRNLEYAVYLFGLIMVVKANSYKSWQFVAAVISLGLLVTSDKLFLSLSVGGALVALLAFALARKRQLILLALRWLVASLAAALIATGVLWLLQHFGVTHFSATGQSSPYKLILNFRHMLLGGTFALLHTLTNFGANPAYDVGTLRQVPGAFFGRLLRPWGISYLINLLVLLIAAILTIWLSFRTVFNKSSRPADQPAQLTLVLLFSSLAAVAAFVLTDHYFAADARYLTILLITGFIGLATALRRWKFNDQTWAAAGFLLVISCIMGLLVVQRTQTTNQQALELFVSRNQTVNQALQNHPVKTLVGDYWRVLPIKQISKNNQTVTPLSDCTTPAGLLSSKEWQADLDKKSFAYLLSLDTQLAQFPNCKLDQVVSAYGRPNASTLIAGKLDAPKEVLLFYDHGTNKSEPKQNAGTPVNSTVLPIKIEQLPYRNCNTSTTVNLVAHQDDDLLFMSPDLLHEVQGTDCVRSIYLTAGDAGSDQLYWTAREKAVEAAYSKMLGSDAIWVERIAQIDEHQFAIVANPRGNPRITLIFLRLPDGNLRGEGFADNRFESIEGLQNGRFADITSVDHQSTYSYQQLTTAIGRLIQNYRPDQIHTQDPTNLSTYFPDHSDHLATGRLFQAAQRQTESLIDVPVTYYVGYPVRQSDPNLGSADLNAKTEAFLAYAQYDGAVCHSPHDCLANPTLGSYLQRMYSAPY